mgnify:CR=1 FL=1
MGRLFADTDQAVENELIARLRQVPSWRKLDMMAQLSAATRHLMLIGLRERHPGASPAQLRRRLAHMLYGSNLPDTLLLTQEPMDNITPEPIRVMLDVTGILEALDITYVVGGSLAAALHGVSRATIDVDLVVALRPEHVAPLLAALGSDYYADEPTIREAVADRGSFNLIHLPTLFKVDVFVTTRRPFDALQLQRRERRTVTQEGRAAYLLSAEDSVLAKLDWHQRGGGASARQWQDVLSVLLAQGDRIDLTYLRAAAADLGVAALLERALRESNP